MAGGATSCWVLLHGTPLTPAVWDGVAALAALVLGGRRS
jgi:hypothetical protein